MESEIGKEPVSHLEQHEADLRRPRGNRRFRLQAGRSPAVADFGFGSSGAEAGDAPRNGDAAASRWQRAFRGSGPRRPEGDVRNARYRTGEGVVGLVIETAQPVVIPRVSEEPRFQNRIYNRPPKDCEEISFLCVPIRLEGELIGTLSVDLPAQSPGLLPERVRVLEIVASMIAYDVQSRQDEALQRQHLRRRISGCAMHCRSSSGRRTSSATRTPCARST